MHIFSARERQPTDRFKSHQRPSLQEEGGCNTKKDVGDFPMFILLPLVLIAAAPGLRELAYCTSGFGGRGRSLEAKPS